MCVAKDDKNDLRFLFVDFDKSFIYKYEGFEPNSGQNSRLKTKEVVSDIMEFMFISIELDGCGRRLDCKFCNNTNYMKERLVALLNKYSDADKSYPLIAEKGTTLLELEGAKVPFLTPLQMANHYLNNKPSKSVSEQSILYKSIHKMLAGFCE